MQYVALFACLTMCLLVGGLMHAILRPAYSYRLVRVIAAPGMVVRKLSMSMAALLTGATLTQVNIYRLKEQEIGFQGDGPSAAAKALAPVAPLFACALALQSVNAVLGSPVNDLTFNISSLGAEGPRGFLLGLWGLMSDLVAQFLKADWRSLRLYFLLVFLFSFSFGACVPLNRFREALIGAGIIAAALAAGASLLGTQSGLFTLPFGSVPGSPASRFAQNAEDRLIALGGAAVVMMFGGMIAAILLSLVVRIFEMVGKATGGAKGGEGGGKSEKRAAA